MLSKLIYTDKHITREWQETQRKKKRLIKKIRNKKSWLSGHKQIRVEIKQYDAHKNKEINIQR